MASNITRIKPRAKPAKQHTPDPVVARIVLVFEVDGQTVASAQLPPVTFPVPPNDQAVTLAFKLDGREVLKALEPALGPQPPSAKLWTPGA